MTAVGRFGPILARIEDALAEDPTPGMPLDADQLTALVGEHGLTDAEYAAWLAAGSERLWEALAEPAEEPADVVAAARATAAVAAVAVLLLLTLAGALVGAVRLTYRRWRP